PRRGWWACATAAARGGQGCRWPGHAPRRPKARVPGRAAQPARVRHETRVRPPKSLGARTGSQGLLPGLDQLIIADGLGGRIFIVDPGHRRTRLIKPDLRILRLVELGAKVTLHARTLKARHHGLLLLAKGVE